MIIYHKTGEIDREQWDNCIRNSSCLKPYPYSWYLDIMSPGWEALVDDEYDSVFPLPVAGKFGVKYIEAPLFLRQLGAFSPDKPADMALMEFLHYLPDFYRLLDMNVCQKVDIDGYRITERTDYELDLSKPYEVLRENFSPVCLKYIEASEKKGLELTNAITPADLMDLFILNEGSEIKGMKSSDFQRLRNLMNFCIINRKGKILGVRGARKKLVFGIFIVEIKGSITILCVASTPQSREKRMTYFALNEIIRAKASTKTTLDFAVLNVPGSPFSPEAFGAAKFPYYRIYFNKLFWPVRIFR